MLKIAVLKKFIRKLRHQTEYALFVLLMFFLRFLSVKQASNLAGWVGRTFGPYLRSRVKISRINLQRAFPGITPERIIEIQRGMFDNFARTFIEYFYLDKFDECPDFVCEVIGENSLEKIRKDGKAGVFYSAHYGNWEIGAWYSSRHGYALTPIYRHVNNPYLDRLLIKKRLLICNGLIAKGQRAGIEAMRALKSGKNLVLLVDQKMGEGIEVPFFGYPTPTAVGIVKIARASKSPLIPTRIRRVNKLHFIIEFLPPLTYEDYAHKDDFEILSEINLNVEAWVREYPEQWFWLHRRWEKSLYL